MSFYSICLRFEKIHSVSSWLRLTAQCCRCLNVPLHNRLHELRRFFNRCFHGNPNDCQLATAKKDVGQPDPPDPLRPTPHCGASTFFVTAALSVAYTSFSFFLRFLVFAHRQDSDTLWSFSFYFITYSSSYWYVVTLSHRLFRLLSVVVSTDCTEDPIPAGTRLEFSRRWREMGSCSVTICRQYSAIDSLSITVADNTPHGPTSHALATKRNGVNEPYEPNCFRSVDEPSVRSNIVYNQERELTIRSSMIQSYFIITIQL